MREQNNCLFCDLISEQPLLRVVLVFHNPDAGEITLFHVADSGLVPPAHAVAYPIPSSLPDASP